MENLKNCTVLYIDDDDFIRENASEYLSRYSRVVYEASDGEEGWKTYLTKKPDIIISDIRMPGIDGLELVGKIRENDRETPVILVTAYTNMEYLLRAVELQLVKYVIKPVTEEKLEEALKMACERLFDKSAGTVRIDEVTFYDRLNKTLVVEGSVVKLTYNEQRFFDLLVDNAHRCVRYEEIERHIWPYEGMSMDALRSLVRSLRRKLAGEVIENQSGIGYKLNAIL